MSKGIISPGGLKYTLSDEVYWEVVYRDADSNVVWNEINTSIESAALWPSFLSVLVYCICTVKGFTPWYMPVVYSMGVYLLGEIMSNWASFFVYNPLLKIVMGLYFIISRFYLNYVVAFVLSLIYVNDLRMWFYTPIVYIVGTIVLNLILTLSIGSYKQREPFNDRVARLAMDR